MSEVIVRCANDTTACSWRHLYHCALEDAVSTLIYEIMLDIIVG